MQDVEKRQATDPGMLHFPHCKFLISPYYLQFYFMTHLHSTQHHFHFMKSDFIHNLLPQIYYLDNIDGPKWAGSIPHPSVLRFHYGQYKGNAKYRPPEVWM
jgi:hypothetical protein